MLQPTVVIWILGILGAVFIFLRLVCAQLAGIQGGGRGRRMVSAAEWLNNQSKAART